MRLSLLCLSLLMPVAPLLAGEPLPSDVQRFIDRREGCDHMRGEVPEHGEKQRMREVSRDIEKLCKGTDKKLAQLKKKHAMNLSVMRRLDEFEPGLEVIPKSVSVGRTGLRQQVAPEMFSPVRKFARKEQR
jgi:hypothetical protein